MFRTIINVQWNTLQLNKAAAKISVAAAVTFHNHLQIVAKFQNDLQKAIFQN